MNRRAVESSLAVVALCTLAGCGGGAEAVPDASPTPSLVVPSVGPEGVETGSPIGSPSASAASSTDVATTATPTTITSRPAVVSADEISTAISVVDRWVTVMDGLYAKPAGDTGVLSSVAAGPALQMSKGFVADFKSAKMHTQGETTLAWKKTTASAVTQNVSIVEVTACVDSSKLRILTEANKDVTKRAYGDRVIQKYTMNKKASDPWLVYSINSSGEKC